MELTIFFSFLSMSNKIYVFFRMLGVTLQNIIISNQFSRILQLNWRRTYFQAHQNSYISMIRVTEFKFMVHGRAILSDCY